MNTVNQAKVKAVVSDNWSEMKVYVGTYAKYNDGSIFGKWLDIADYKNIKEFYDACRELHKDEDDPEFMFQDWEYIPAGFISECHISEELFELSEALDEEDVDLDVFLEYCEYESAKPSIQLVRKCRDAYVCLRNEFSDYAKEMAVEDIRNICNSEAWHFVESNFDYEGYARELMMDMYETENYVFRNS